MSDKYARLKGRKGARDWGETGERVPSMVLCSCYIVGGCRESDPRAGPQRGRGSAAVGDRSVSCGGGWFYERRHHRFSQKKAVVVRSGQSGGGGGRAEVPPCLTETYFAWIWHPSPTCAILLHSETSIFFSSPKTIRPNKNEWVATMYISIFISFFLATMSYGGTILIQTEKLQNQKICEFDIMYVYVLIFMPWECHGSSGHLGLFSTGTCPQRIPSNPIV